MRTDDGTPAAVISDQMIGAYADESRRQVAR